MSWACYYCSLCKIPRKAVGRSAEKWIKLYLSHQCNFALAWVHRTSYSLALQHRTLDQQWKWHLCKQWGHLLRLCLSVSLTADELFKSNCTEAILISLTTVNWSWFCLYSQLHLQRWYRHLALPWSHHSWCVVRIAEGTLKNSTDETSDSFIVRQTWI